MNNLSLILGGPGCGKTTRLLTIVEDALKRGVPADRIGFVAFTKAAASEAARRAAMQFSLDAEKDLPWFRTIHSLAYQRLGMMRGEMMDSRDWKDFESVVNEPLTGASNFDPSGVFVEGAKYIGDVMLRVIDLAAATLRAPEDVSADLDVKLDPFRLRRFADCYAAYKTNTAKMDFSDLLRIYAADGKPLDIEIGIIDEAQDLTPLQWQAVTRAFSRAKNVYVGGDDDQAIYHWAGADVERFLTLHAQPEVLPTSHRLPKDIWRYARAIAERISTRYVKEFRARDAAGGWIDRISSVEEIDVGSTTSGTWLLLARNIYMLRDYEDMLRRSGVPYLRRTEPAIDPAHVELIHAWKQKDMLSAKQARGLFDITETPRQQIREARLYTREDLTSLPWGAPWSEAFTKIPDDVRRYYVACANRGNLTKVPHVRVDTIHGVKGAEADHVALMPDMSAKTYEAYRRAPDNEHRVFYVGATRARHSLHLLAPKSLNCYPL